MKTKWITASLFFCLCTGSALAGPFGLERGMSKQQVIAIIGQSAIIDQDVAFGEIRVRTVPKPHSYFERYDLYFSPMVGLVRVEAIGRDIQSSGDGAAVKEQYNALRAALTEVYGTGEEMVNNPSDGMWTEEKYFLMAILKKERFCNTFWMFKGQVPRADYVTALDEELRATSADNGYVTVDYEFSGWEAFVDQVQAKQNSNL
jgi:hypothetical protein